MKAMDEFDPCVGDLKMLMVLNEICMSELTDMQIVLHTDENSIKDIAKMSFSDIFRLQGNLQAKPPS